MYLRKIPKKKTLSDFVHEAENFSSQQHFSKLRVHPHGKPHKSQNLQKSLLSLLTLPSTCKTKKTMISSSLLRKYRSFQQMH